MESAKTSSPSPSVKVTTFGRFLLEVNGQPVSFAAKVPKRSLELLKVLIALGGEAVTVETLQESLWPDSDGDHAQGAFASALHRLRAIIGEAALVQADSRLTLSTDCQVDSLVCNDLLKEASQALDEQDGEAARQIFKGVFELYQGPFLAGEFEPPEILSARERLHAMFLHQLNRLGDFLTRAQAHAGAIDLYQKGLQADELAEELYQRLMRCYARQGQVADAVAVYERMQRVLRSGAGVEPSRESEQLYNEILSTQPPQPEEQIAVATARPGNDPAAQGGGPVARTRERPAIRRRTTALAVAATFVLAAAVVGGWIYNQQRAAEAALAAFQREAAFPLPEKPSIAVLAFDNLSGDPEQESFSDGIAEDIISDLSRISGIFVVSRNSSFTFKGKPVDVAEVGRKLGVRYVLEGSFRKAGNRIRLSVQLIDAASRTHIWAERYERELKDVFAVQDEITGEIVSSLKVQVTMGEAERIRRNTTDSAEAWEFYRKGIGFYRIYTRPGHRIAREMFYKALELDPEFEAALVALGKVYASEGRFGWKSDVPDPYERASKLANQALELDKTLAEPHTLLAAILLNKKHYDRAVAAAERATAIEPNVADFQSTLAYMLNLAGRHEEALAAIEKALRMNPRPPIYYWNTLGIILYFVGKPEEAIPHLKKVHGLTGWGSSLIFLIASNAAAGRIEDAKWHAEYPPRLMAPSLVLAKKRPYKHPTDLRRVLADLAKAGVK